MTNKTSDYYCLFSFHPLLFVQLLQFLSRLFLAATLYFSHLFVSFLRFLVSTVIRFPSSPLSCVAAAMFGSETAIAKFADHP